MVCVFSEPNTEPGDEITTNRLCCWLYREKDCCDSVRLHSNELVANQGTLMLYMQVTCVYRITFSTSMSIIIPCVSYCCKT